MPAKTKPAKPADDAQPEALGDDAFTDPSDERGATATFGDMIDLAKHRVNDPDATYTDKGALAHKVVPALHDHLVDVRKINPHPDNPNEGDIPAIAVSLDHYGQVRPILVQKSTGFIVAGNHTYKAARLLGWQYVAAVVTDMDEADALKYLLADNQIAKRATVKVEKVTDLLNDGRLLFDPDNPTVMGWTTDELVAEFGDQLSFLQTTDAGAEMPAEYASNDEQKQRRDKRTTEPLREVVLMMTKAQTVQLGEKLDYLRTKLKVEDEGVTAVLLAVVDFTYEAAGGTAPDDDAPGTHFLSDPDPDVPDTSDTDPAQADDDQPL